MKNNYNLLQIQLQETQAAKKIIEDTQLIQYQKDAAARAHVEELRQRNAEAKILSEQRLNEAKEAEFMRNANPDILDYYNDLIRMGENVSDIRTQMLSKRTLVEAQMLFLKTKRKAGPGNGV